MRYFSALTLLLAASMLSSCDSMPSWMGGGKKSADPLPGERLSVLPDRETQLKPDSSLTGYPMDIPSSAEISDWPQHGGNATSSIGQPNLGDIGAEKSNARVGSGAAYTDNFAAPPVISEGKLFAMDGEGALSAHDAANISRVLWTNKGVANKDEEPMLGGGLAYADNTVYAVSGRGLVAAYNADTGAELWRQDLVVPVRAAPKLNADKLYIVTSDSQLIAIDAKTGKTIWAHRGINEGASFLTHASPSIARGAVVAPYSSGEIFILNAENGKEIWSDALAPAQRTIATGLFSDIGTDPVIVSNALYAISNAGVLGAYRLDNGQRIWEQKVASVNPLWVAGNTIFMLTTDQTLLALNRMDGRVYWSTPLPRYRNAEDKKNPYSWSGPVLAGGKLYIAGAHGKMTVVNPQDGSVIKTLDIPNNVYSAPVVANNTLYLVTKDARLYAY